jgi:hypothetical protein
VLKRYRKSGVTSEPDTFALYRIIGNDLPPLHERGQARRNLEFILEHEPEFAACVKRFVVNRIVDEQEERQIVSLLEQAHVPYVRIPFNWAEYVEMPLDREGIPEQYLPQSKRYRRLREDEQQRVCARMYRHKNNYVMNNNGARNAALDDGTSVAKWIMPWDGNCFLTQSAYDEICEAVRNHSCVPYLLVRMIRLDENLQAIEQDLSVSTAEEPQIVFRRDAAMRFHPAFPYGRRPKVELLWRLGVPGPWDEWGIEPWDLPCPAHASEAGGFESAGWVARLSAAPGGYGLGSVDASQRTAARTQAIVQFLQRLDRQCELQGDRTT